MTNQKYPQNLQTSKNIFFADPPPPKKKKKEKKIEFKIVNPKNDPSLRLFENIRVFPWKFLVAIFNLSSLM